MNDFMKKMPRPSTLRRFSWAKGSGMEVGSKPDPWSWMPTSSDFSATLNKRSTRFSGSRPLPCLIALTTDSRTATLM